MAQDSQRPKASNPQTPDEWREWARAQLLEIARTGGGRGGATRLSAVRQLLELEGINLVAEPAEGDAKPGKVLVLDSETIRGLKLKIAGGK